MKSQKLIVLMVSLSLLFSCNETLKQEADTTKEEPEVKKEGVQPFAENIFSQYTNVRDFTINTTEDEAYFSLQSPGRELSIIMKMKKENNVWQTPEISNFSGKYTDLEPFLSPDNLKLYFASNRPVVKDSTATKDFDIWYVERENLDSEWSSPQNLEAPVNTKADEFYPAITNTGNLYFTSITEETGPADDIFISRLENNSYTKPIILSDSINTKGAEFNAFIAPDESYIIFSGWRRPDGIGAGDMYISKKVDGQWTKAKNLGETINSKQTDFCPFVNKGKLYFTSRRSNVTSKENGFTSTEELLSEINRYDNGYSRIYQVDISKLLNQ
ncbi:TolB family protein [Winogradskyella jejuensis]|uniref:WD40-like Beta Propeller Repeat n=1 Tax=Winogradskyella jejuensis TaxID=1089305 RepID=A0A1M5N9B4_9FLAO|nr:PD40 domain-containing protein [Winogradskyella jejuensis]SHG86101.1 WD40-like Beta Propeller Repeat [Winogradskyella jejuensis]